MKNYRKIPEEILLYSSESIFGEISRQLKKKTEYLEVDKRLQRSLEKSNKIFLKVLPQKFPEFF